MIHWKKKGLMAACGRKVARKELCRDRAKVECKGCKRTVVALDKAVGRARVMGLL